MFVSSFKKSRQLGLKHRIKDLYLVTEYIKVLFIDDLMKSVTQGKKCNNTLAVEVGRGKHLQCPNNFSISQVKQNISIKHNASFS
jgi:hypothetical protein